MINFVAHKVLEFWRDNLPQKPFSEEDSEKIAEFTAEWIVGALRLIDSLGLDAHDDDVVDEVMNEVRAILDKRKTTDEQPEVSDLQSA